MYNHDQVPNEKVKLYVKQVVVEGKSSVSGGGGGGGDGDRNCTAQKSTLTCQQIATLETRLA